MERRRMRAANLKGSEAKRDDNKNTISIGKLIAKLEVQARVHYQRTERVKYSRD